MTTIDISQLLAEVSTEPPCGPDMGYEPAFRELLLSAQSKRPASMVSDAEGGAADGPDWRIVQRRADEMFSKTKDLRIALVLIKAMLGTQGLSGLSAGLGLLRQMCERYWDGVHPRLDPDDDNDPTMRLNILSELCDRDGVLQPLRSAPLLSHTLLGSFGLRDIGLASGEIKLAAESTEVPPTMNVIDGAFRGCSLEDLQATAGAAQSAVDEIKLIEEFVTGKVGLQNALRLSELSDVLQQINRFLRPRIEARSKGQAELIQPGDAAGSNDLSRAVGSVNSRDDVIRLLETLCEYYERNEPSSPIPVLLRRCKRLVPMAFMEIVKELVPDGFLQFEMIRGPEQTGGS